MALIVERDEGSRASIRALLAEHRWNTIEASTLAAALDEVHRHVPDIILVDPDLPDGDGLDVLGVGERMLAAIVMSTRSREIDKVAALDRGADDYLTKPFGATELMARIRALLRRTVPRTVETVAVGPIRIDPVRREVTLDGSAIHLTPIEFTLLARLARTPGIVVERRQLLRDIWGGAAVESHQYLRVHIAALRKKLEMEPGRPKWLCTVNGVGYRLGSAEPG